MNRHINNSNSANLHWNNKNRDSLSVCIFSHSALLAGAERALLELVKELTEDYGVICTIILPENGPLIKKFHEVGASTFIVNYSWWCDLNLLFSDDIKLRLNASFLEVYKFIKKYFDRINPDIILSNTLVVPWGAITALLLNKPHLWFIHEYGKKDHNFEFYLPFQQVLKFVRDSSNIILTNSNAVKHTLLGHSPEEKIMTIYQYIDIEVHAHHAEHHYFLRKTSTKLSILGAISKTKGHKDCVLALSELVKKGKDVELIMMGASSSSHFLQELNEIAKRNHLERDLQVIDFKENPYPLIEQSDIILVCSRCEAFGRCSLEAMLFKKPVIGTNTGGTPELIKEGYNGLLYRSGDYLQLADKIQYFIDHPEKIPEFGECGYKLAKDNFTKEGYGGKVYKILLGLKGKSNPFSKNIGLLLKNWGIDHIDHLEKLKEKENIFKNDENTVNQKEERRNGLNEINVGVPSGNIVNLELVNRILIIKLDHIGDVILSIPAVRLLRNKFPNAHISMLVGSWAQMIAKKIPEIDEVLLFDFFYDQSGKGKRTLNKKEIEHLQEMLISRNFDLAIDMKRHPETRDILKLSGARYTVGYSTGGDDNWLTLSLQPSKDIEDIAMQTVKQHHTAQLCQLVQSINTDTVNTNDVLTPYSPILSMEKEEVPSYPYFLKGNFPVGLHPGVGNLMRQWPLEYFALLADLLIERNHATIFLFGGREDKKLTSDIYAKIKNKDRVTLLAGKFSLDEFMKAVTYCHLFIGNNSGPCHIAGIMGVPTLAIFSGQTSPHEWHPLGKKTMSIRVDTPCSPCYKASPEDCLFGLKCLKLLRPEKVIEAVDQLLAISGVSKKL